VALCAFVHQSAEAAAALDVLRAALEARTGLAVTVGFGPRFLHSTGQLHKGGPAKGLFVQITATEGPDVPIPGRPYGFGRLIAAQADGDLDVLVERARPAVRIHVPAAGLPASIAAIAAHLG
jgi:hypothetical protein